MKRFFLISLFLILTVNFIHSEDITFRTHNIADAAKVIGLVDVVKTLPIGYTILKKDGAKICVNINKNKEVEHIGIPVFSKTQRKLMPSPIYNFIEYANLVQFYKLKSGNEKHQYIHFVNGSWKDLANIDENIQVVIKNVDGKIIDVSWNTTDKRKKIELKFPIMYELITNSSRKELEDNFTKDLHHAIGTISYNSKPMNADDVNDLYLLANATDTIYKHVNDTLFIQDISDATYYKKKESKYQLLFDHKYETLSYSNMFLKGLQSDIQKIKLTINKQDFSTETISSTVSKLLKLLKIQGNKNYVGLRQADSKEIQFSLYSYNETLGYVHLFILRGETGGLCNNTLLANCYLYIPTSNLSNLYSDHSTEE